MFGAKSGSSVSPHRDDFGILAEVRLAGHVMRVHPERICQRTITKEAAVKR